MIQIDIQPNSKPIENWVNDYLLNKTNICEKVEKHFVQMKNFWVKKLWCMENSVKLCHLGRGIFPEQPK